MDFGDPLFYETPRTDADVPLAAMRALARKPAPFQFQSEFKLKPPTPHPVQDVAPPPGMVPHETAPAQMEPSWKSYIDAFSKTQQKGEEAHNDDLLSRVEKILKEAREAASVPPAPSATAYPDLSMNTGVTGIDDYLYKNRQFESGNNPYAKNKGSGASGLYQFLPSTWEDLAKEAPQLGLTSEGIFDAEQQNRAMRYYTEKSAMALRPILGRSPTGGELYALHLLGHAGGAHVVQNPAEPLTKIISKAAMDANPWLYNYPTGKDLINALNRRFS